MTKHQWFLFLAAVLFLLSCGDTITRNKVTYQTDLNFFEKASVDQADAGEKAIAARCTCSKTESGVVKFDQYECLVLAGRIQEARAWVPYIKARALHSAGLLDKLPPEPEVPPATDLCPGGK